MLLLLLPEKHFLADFMILSVVANILYEKYKKLLTFCIKRFICERK